MGFEGEGGTIVGEIEGGAEGGEGASETDGVSAGEGGRIAEEAMAGATGEEGEKGGDEGGERRFGGRGSGGAVEWRRGG